MLLANNSNFSYTIKLNISITSINDVINIYINYCYFFNVIIFCFVSQKKKLFSCTENPTFRIEV